MFRTTVRRSSSRIRAIWRSVLSWTLWLVTTPQRLIRARQLRQETRRQEHLAQMSSLVRTELLDALTSLAHALERQDRLLVEEMRRTRVQQEAIREQQQELLMEVLASLQPPAESQLLPLLGSTPPRSRGSLVR